MKAIAPYWINAAQWNAAAAAHNAVAPQHRIVEYRSNMVGLGQDILYMIATDCLRLSMHFFHPIQQCAQQVYYTALPLSPTSSHLHRSYLQSTIDDQLSYITTFSGAPKTWGSLLRTIGIRPRQLTCIATSIQQIISACEDIVHIYDAVTGVLQQSLCAPEAVVKIKASPDGTFLFFVHSSSVTMWDVQTGGHINTFHVQSWICDLAVSTTFIACGLYDGSVIFWNIHTKEKSQVFGNDHPVITVLWLTPQELAVASQGSVYIHNIVTHKTQASFSFIEPVWGMVLQRYGGVLLVGTSEGENLVRSSFEIIRLLEEHSQEDMHSRERSHTYHGQLLNPTLAGDDVVCITPPSGVQIFDTRTHMLVNNPPLLGAAISVAVSLNRNLVVQTQDSIQIFSIDVLTSNEIHESVQPSHIYPLGKMYIICLLQPNRKLAILKLWNLQDLRRNEDTPSLRSLLMGQSTSARGLVAEFGVPAVMEAWRSGAPLPELSEVANEDRPLSGLSPDCARVATVHRSPRQEVRVKDMKTGTTLAKLRLKRDDLGGGEVYDLIFHSETGFSLKIDGPGWHIQIAYDVVASPSGRYSHTIVRGEPVTLSEPRVAPPYTLDANYEWVVDAQSRKICWISPGNVRRGSGGHFWAGLSLVMVGDDGVVRKVTFREPNR